MPYNPQFQAGPYKAAHITSNTTTNIGTLGSVLHAIIVGNAGSGETITVNDGTGGTTISVISPVVGYTYVFDYVTVNTTSSAISIVTAGTTAGDYTVLWSN